MMVVKEPRKTKGKRVCCYSCGKDTTNKSNFCDECNPVEMVEDPDDNGIDYEQIIRYEDNDMG